MYGSQPPLCPLCISNPSVSHTKRAAHAPGPQLKPADVHTRAHTCTHITAAINFHTRANRQRGFITQQISFKFAMKDQFIKNALNRSGFS